MNAAWDYVAPSMARSLSDARRQLHHAAQLATAFGISYLAKEADDSHTNLEWIPESGSLASRPVNGARIALRVSDLALAVNGQELELRGRTVAEAVAFIRKRLAEAGLDPSRFTLERHYEIPSHPVATGKPFDASIEHLGQLSCWMGNASAQLERVRASDPRASEVRCWPHHFDIATLIAVGDGRTVGAGMEPGDGFYDEPYFYVNMNPSPVWATLPPSIEGGGRWHTRGWIGAVLPGSRLVDDREVQAAQAEDFIDSAIGTCISLISR